MATIKLGALVTAIAGSIGGWTFRRSGGSTIVYSRPNGAGKDKLRTNPALVGLRVVNQSWSLLTQVLRDAWVTASPHFLFPDKFGKMVALSGRMLFIKLTSSLYLVGRSSPDPTTLDSTIAGNTIVSASIISAGVKQITMANLVPNIDNIVTIEQVKNSSISPTFSRRKMLLHTQVGVTVVITLTTEFDLKFPFVQAGDNFIIYVTPQNLDGFRANPLSIKAVAT